MKGTAIPKGSYIELTIDSIPRLVHGRSLTLTLKPNLSFSTDHDTSKALSVGRASSARSNSLTSLALS